MNTLKTPFLYLTHEDILAMCESAKRIGLPAPPSELMEESLKVSREPAMFIHVTITADPSRPPTVTHATMFVALCRKSDGHVTTFPLYVPCAELARVKARMPTAQDTYSGIMLTMSLIGEAMEKMKAKSDENGES